MKYRVRSSKMCGSKLIGNGKLFSAFNLHGLHLFYSDAVFAAIFRPIASGGFDEQLFGQRHRDMKGAVFLRHNGTGEFSDASGNQKTKRGIQNGLAAGNF